MASSRFFMKLVYTELMNDIFPCSVLKLLFWRYLYQEGGNEAVDDNGGHGRQPDRHRPGCGKDFGHLQEQDKRESQGDTDG